MHITTPDDMTPELRRQLVDCWRTVANTDGAVGFAFPPVDTRTVTPVADRLVANLAPQRDRLVLATFAGPSSAGCG